MNSLHHEMTTIRSEVNTAIDIGVANEPHLTCATMNDSQLRTRVILKKIFIMRRLEQIFLFISTARRRHTASLFDMRRRNLALDWWGLTICGNQFNQKCFVIGQPNRLTSENGVDLNVFKPASFFRFAIVNP